MFAVDADPRHGRFGLRTDCPRCGEHLPVNGPATAVDCAACGHRLDVPERLLRDLIADFERGWPRPQSSGTVVQGDLTWRWTARAVEHPTCSCGGRLAEPEPGRGTVTCASCGGSAPVLAVPRAIARQVDTATAVIGGSEDLSRPPSPPEPVALQCPSCSGGLRIDVERERITRCDFCGSQVHLPDAVWRMLHPPCEVREWFVRFEGESEAARTAREKAAAAEAKAEAKRRKAKERAEREAAQRAEQERELAAREAEQARRDRLGALGAALTWTLTLLACVVMSLTVALWALPVPALAPPRPLTAALVGVGAAAFLVAWLVGHAVCAWRARFTLPSTLLFSAVLLVMLLLPGMSMVTGFMLAAGYAYGRFPTPAGEEYKNFRHAHRTGWALAVLFVVAGFFVTAAVGSLADLTVGEMIDKIPAD